MQATVIIPARLRSKRFHGKVLVNIQGKTLLQRCWESVKMSCPYPVYIATGDAVIMQEAHDFGAKTVIVTDDFLGRKVRNGTERVAIAASLLQLKPDDIVINCQADAFGFYCIDTMVKVCQEVFKNPGYMVTVGYPIPMEEDELGGHYFPNVLFRKLVHSENTVKVLEKDGQLGFTRHLPNYIDCKVYIHYGIYAARKIDFDNYLGSKELQEEQEHQLEQLRWKKIKLIPIPDLPAKVDTKEDLTRAELKAKFHDCYVEFFEQIKGLAGGACGEFVSVPDISFSAYSAAMRKVYGTHKQI